MRLMSTWFLVLAGLTLVGACAAMMMRSLVHCALALAVAFAGIGTLYLYLGAQFLGLAQLLVYVGAIAVLIVFVVLLTRESDPDAAEPVTTVLTGMVIAAAVFGVVVWAAFHSFAQRPAMRMTAPVTVRELGTELMSAYVLPLEVIGLMLTAALIGAAIVAMKENAR
jgi:NADH-quinone oxidoreductase subunit J